MPENSKASFCNTALFFLPTLQRAGATDIDKEINIGNMKGISHATELSQTEYSKT